jgi:hypothetical protein
MIGMRKRVMGIRLGHEPVVFASATEAGRETDAKKCDRVFRLAETGKETEAGWSFDYPLEERNDD